MQDSLCVDAAWNTATGDMEYQGIYYKTGDLVFKQGPYPDGTNNIGEFLAIVHALAYCKKEGASPPAPSIATTAGTRHRLGSAKESKDQTRAHPPQRGAIR